MTSINDFSSRYSLSEIVASKIYELFNKNEVELIPFGFENISKGNKELKKFINTPESNLSHSAMIVKFAPGSSCLRRNCHKKSIF